MKLFHVYGKDENKNRLYPSLINSIKKKTSFHMTRGTQINDFVHIDKVTDILLDSLDFKKRNSKFPQYWEIGTGKNIQTKIFVKNILDQFFIKKKIMFGKIKKNSHNYFSNKKFIWKIN
jgi:nucleoside-diphosphate-sugar epimerase